MSLIFQSCSWVQDDWGPNEIEVLNVKIQDPGPRWEWAWELTVNLWKPSLVENSWFQLCKYNKNDFLFTHNLVNPC